MSTKKQYIGDDSIQYIAFMKLYFTFANQSIASGTAVGIAAVAELVKVLFL